MGRDIRKTGQGGAHRLPRRCPLEPGVPLPAHGLDSLGMVGLSASLEDAYDFTFPDAALVPATFASPEKLWDTVSACLQGTP
ncbi:phosphopantetheine-binding protein [Streptomyces sp. RKAG293]|uniref:phosphopantetheine-binding protein n=1 Tax=Streptomyces sp. RKAG293 TaxID=2893403 RepID=UPI0035A93294